jgi:hypothetical protein
MSQHTPGPWRRDGLTTYALNEHGWNRFSAQVQDPHTPLEELLANARLIAAAPEMLEALELVKAAILNEGGLNDGVVTDTLWVSDIETAVDRIDAAIAKARGS